MNIKHLIGQEVNLFDTSGGVLSVDGEYHSDWWNHSNKFILVKDIGKYFYLKDPRTGQYVKHKVSRIDSIEGNDLYLRRF